MAEVTMEAIMGATTGVITEETMVETMEVIMGGMVAAETAMVSSCFLLFSRK